MKGNTLQKPRLQKQLLYLSLVWVLRLLLCAADSRWFVTLVMTTLSDTWQHFLSLTIRKQRAESNTTQGCVWLARLTDTRITTTSKRTSRGSSRHVVLPCDLYLTYFLHYCDILNYSGHPKHIQILIVFFFNVFLCSIYFLCFFMFFMFYVM